MNKNITINIGGIIFHIEEVAFEQLRKYMEDISNYFSQYDGSEEIIADIESRIAEIFSSKVSESKQVLIQEDVDFLINTMGKVEDFQAMEDDTDPNYNRKKQYKNTHTTGESSKLYRDEKRKIVGGVCAGLGYYFNIDATFARLLFVTLTLATVGIGLLAYALMWAFIPGTYLIPENNHIKKVFRDPEDKIAGGVSSGIAKYLGIEPVIIRIAFVVISVAYLVGAFIYLILWAILPEAKSITDKVQMEGNPVTLDNIKSSLKKKSKLTEEQKSTLSRILLYPFKLLGLIIKSFADILKPLIIFFIDCSRIISGFIMMIIGAIFLLSIIVIIGMTWQMLEFNTVWLPFLNIPHYELGYPAQQIFNSIPEFTLICVGLLFIIPLVFLIMLGASAVAKRIIFSTSTGWTLFTVFMVSALILSFNLPAIAWEFKEANIRKSAINYTFKTNYPLLKLNFVEPRLYHNTTLSLNGYNGKSFKLQQTLKARGHDRKSALRNIDDVSYHTDHNDSSLIFDSNLIYKPESTFHKQRIDLKLNIPRNQPFRIHHSLFQILEYPINEIYPESTWIFNSNDELECLTCPDDLEEDDIEE